MAVLGFYRYKVYGSGLAFLGAGMTTSAHARTNICGLIAIVVLSSATMLWLFWHFPVGTGIATVVVLSAFGVLARLARLVDTDSMSDLDRGNQNA